MNRVNINNNFFQTIAERVIGILVGFVFLFSSITKSLSYNSFINNIKELFQFLEMNNDTIISPLIFLSLFFEFFLGAFLLFSYKKRITVLISALLVMGFAIINLFKLVYMPPDDCGCFGDVIILTTKQSLVLDLILLVLLVFLLKSFSNHNGDSNEEKT